jgi:serine/threonine protein kinase
VSTDPRVGTQIGDYRIDSVLGRGGMSVVYLAEHIRLKRKAALKLLSPELAEDPTFRARFVSEWERLAQLDHPNIIPVFEAGEADGSLYIAMRYVRTTDLKALIEQQGHLDPERAIRIASQTASALDAAHAQSLVHRDVKPANILVAVGAGPQGTDHVYLSDFGLTKHTQSQSGLTQTGHFMGTIDYVAPEQISGKDVDGGADQYALGCVLYQCLTGQVPFPREEETSSLFAHLQDEPPRVTAQRPELPLAIDVVVARAMAKEREERFDSCTDFVRAARTALDVPGSAIRPVPAPPVPDTVLAAPPTSPPLADLPSAPSVSTPQARPDPSPAGDAERAAPARAAPARAAPAARKRNLGWVLIVAGVVVALVVAGFVVTQLGGDEADGGNGGPTGDAFLDDFSDPSTGWETGTDAGVTAEYLDGRYDVRMGKDADPGAFKVATGGTEQAGLSLLDERVSVDARILGESDSRRDGFGLTCRASQAGAYYFIVGTTGGWSIQKRIGEQKNPKVLADSSQVQTPVPIRDVNQLRAVCSGAGSEPASLTLTVNGVELPPVVDRDDPLPAGFAGMAVAGPTVFEPDGLAVAFDEFRVDDLSASDQTSG